MIYGVLINPKKWICFVCREFHLSYVVVIKLKTNNTTLSGQ